MEETANREAATPTTGALTLDHVTKLYGDLHAVDDVVARRRPRGVRHAARAVRLGQDDDPAHHRRLHPAGRGHGHARRPRPDQGAAVQARHRHGVPELRPLPAHDRRRERRLPAADAAHPQGRDQEAGRSRRSPSCASSTSATATRSSSPAASSSASRWPARSSSARNCSSWTSRSAPSTSKLREALQLEIMRISRQLGVTVVYVTHDQEEALVMCDRIAIYNEGRIEQIGSGEDLYERPVSLFVADFVGESNIYPGTLQAEPYPSIVRPAGPPIRVPAEAGARVGLTAGDRAAVVIRPERMSIRQGVTGESRTARRRVGRQSAGTPAGAHLPRLGPQVRRRPRRWGHGGGPDPGRDGRCRRRRGPGGHRDLGHPQQCGGDRQRASHRGRRRHAHGRVRAAGLTLTVATPGARHDAVRGRDCACP